MYGDAKDNTMATNRARKALATPVRTALLVDLHWVDGRPDLISAVFDDSGDVYKHILVATSAWLIRRHLPLLINVPLALAPTPAAARAVLLERARTLVGRGFGAARVYADPLLQRAVAEAGLFVVEQSGKRLPRRSSVVGSAR